MKGFSHHGLLVEFFGGTLSEKVIEQIEHILFASGGSARPFQEAIEFRKGTSANFNPVMAALSVLYDTYCEGDGYDDEVDSLMEAYNEWLG